MSLTTAQYQALSAAIIADGSQAANIAAKEDGLMAAWFNELTSFQVWKTITVISDIQNAVIWSNFTPANPAAGAGQDATNWLLACQGKQFNLQMLLTGYGVSTGMSNIRAGLQDATSLIPSGIAGATKSGGWTAIQLIIQRPATNAERILATGIGTTASPGDLSWEGVIQNSDVHALMGE